MDRRRFLRTLIGATAGLVLDPELALWVPGRKTYFFSSQVQAGGVLTLDMLQEYDRLLRDHYEPHIEFMLGSPSVIGMLLKMEKESTYGPVRRTT
jgi:hypothetical protein